MPRNILRRGALLQVDAVDVDLLTPLLIVHRDSGIDNAVGNPVVEMHRCSLARA